MKRQPRDQTRQAAKTGEAGQIPAPPTEAAKRVRRKVAGTPRRANSKTGLTPEEFQKMVAAAAYYRAEQRGFAGGHELEDWLAAEAEIGLMLEKQGAVAGVRRPGKLNK